MDRSISSNDRSMKSERRHLSFSLLLTLRLLSSVADAAFTTSLSGTTWQRRQTTKLWSSMGDAVEQKTDESRTVLRTLTLVDDATDEVLVTGYELAPLTKERDKPDEDELEMLYPTQQQYFQFAQPISESGKIDTPVQQVRTTSFGCGKLGHQVWPSSLTLCLSLINDYHNTEGGSKKLRSVVELGAGCGLPCIVCRDVLNVPLVLATDFWYSDDETNREMDRLMPEVWHGINLEYNVQRHDQGASVRKVDWYDLESVRRITEDMDGSIDLVLASDLVNYPMDSDPLWNTLETLMKDCGAAKVVLVSPLEPATREALPSFQEMLAAKCTEGYHLERQELVLYTTPENLEERINGDRFVKLTLSTK